ncbi:MAG: hypothetical protein J6B97_05545 [Bacteroidales bacterium]|nr:hypothetical protein [Bacteroidales bacterium]
MKRFLIFAAMLVTSMADAVNLMDDPPLITPSPDRIVLVPQDMFDIDRTIALCEYILYKESGTVYISCYGTGRFTELYLTDQNGILLDSIEINSEITQEATLNAPLSSGTYRIILNSEKYHGEDTFTIL